MLRTHLYADPHDKFLHNVILDSCRRFGSKTAIVDTSSNRRFSYAEYGELVETLARGLVASSLRPGETLAALPYSSGTTGLPKGVMLSHFNLIANVFQFIARHGSPLCGNDTVLCFLPLYHIYGLNVILNPVLSLGGTLVLMPRFQVPQLLSLIVDQRVTMMPTVPPALNALCQAAEQGQFPSKHCLRWVKSGAAPLPSGLP